MKSITVGGVTALGVVAGTATIAYRGMKKSPLPIRLGVAAAAAVGGWVAAALVAGFTRAGDSAFMRQEIVRWNTSAVDKEREAAGLSTHPRAWVNLGALGARRASRVSTAKVLAQHFATSAAQADRTIESINRGAYSSRMLDCFARAGVRGYLVGAERGAATNSINVRFTYTGARLADHTALLACIERSFPVAVIP